VLVAALVVSVAPSASARDGRASRRPATDVTVPARRVVRPVPALAPVRADALTRALDRGAIDEANYALERARTLFDLHGVRERFGSVRRADPRGATMILRDLVARLAELGPAQLRVARAILARPTDGPADPFGDGYAVAEAPPLCTENGCVHYVTTTDDAPDLTDVDPANGVPDYVDVTSATLGEVWAAEVTTYGFRAPKSDLTSTNNGGSGLIDVYIAQLGDDGFYGYCTTDDPNTDPTSGYPYYDFSAYCVVDDDFSPFEYPPPAGIEALQVTMAHEFFHAIQFAYDALDDLWFMESTSTWIEDEVYDDVNDSLQFLARSPLSEPEKPLDANNTFNVYGDWIFPRFLVESTGDPTIIRRVWEYADASAIGPDLYGIKAYAKVIKGLETAPGAKAKFRWVFADFGMVNDVPAAFYEEGVDYPIPPYAAKWNLTARRPQVEGIERRFDHLTNRYVGFIPRRGVTSTAKLRVEVDGPAYRTGTEASVVVVLRSGKVRFFPLAISKRGIASRVVPFGKGKVAAVDLVLTNASTRLVGGDCWVDFDWDFSCAGIPRDDGLVFEYGASLIQ
jgi:hypothetical protein